MEDAEYLVYEIVDDLTKEKREIRKRHIVAYCETYGDARTIAVALATVDPKGDEYFVTSVEKGNVFVPGGGWFDAYKRNLKTGQVEERSLG